MVTKFENTRCLLVSNLEIAVPLAAQEFVNNPILLEEFTKSIPDVVSLLGSHGDLLLFSSNKKGSAANGFVKLAKAIAYLCIVNPKGVTLFGTHFKL